MKKILIVGILALTMFSCAPTKRQLYKDVLELSRLDALSNASGDTCSKSVEEATLNVEQDRVIAIQACYRAIQANNEMILILNRWRTYPAKRFLRRLHKSNGKILKQLENGTIPRFTEKY